MDKLVNSYLRVNHVTKDDSEAIRNLFATVFAESMSTDLWNWKYGEGRGHAVIVWKDENLVAHYGGISRSVMTLGNPQTACQICDVMVAPAARAILTRKGPFFLAASGFAKTYYSPGSRYAFCYGFPNHRHLKLGKILGLYDNIAQMTSVYWAPISDHPRFLSQIRSIKDYKRNKLADLINQLWIAMAGDFSNAIIGVRDWDYFKHRYLEHPIKNYHLILVQNRFSRRSLGVVVLRCEARLCELVDLIAPFRNIPYLIDQARRLAKRWNMNEMFCWVTEDYVNLFTNTEGRKRPLDICVPTLVWPQTPELEKIRNKLWLMSGDTDFH